MVSYANLLGKHWIHYILRGYNIILKTFRTSLVSLLNVHLKYAIFKNREEIFIPCTQLSDKVMRF